MKQKTLFKKITFIASLLFSAILFVTRLNLFQQKKDTNVEVQSLKRWKGLWIADKGDILLEISDQSNIYINNQPLALNLQGILQNELVFQDHYGYSMNLTKKSDHTLLLFDEAEGKEYSFSRIAK